ncbi:MAG: RHS repeat domain-containing protein, partial [Verrucomicrobiota bacterium]
MDPMQGGNTLEVVTSHQRHLYDGLSRRIKTIDLLAAEGGMVVSETEYERFGEIRSRISGNTETRHTTRWLEEGGKLKITSLPRSGEDNSHRISLLRYDAEGRIRQAMEYAAIEPFAEVPDRGTLVSNIYTNLGSDRRGAYTERISQANIFNRRVTRTYRDAAGRTTEVIHGYGSSVAGTERYYYDDQGRLQMKVDPDGMTTRYWQDEAMGQSVTAVDLNVESDEAPDHIEWEVDRITRTTSGLTVINGPRNVSRTTTEVFTENGPKLVSVNQATLDGNESWSTTHGATTHTVRSASGHLGNSSVSTYHPTGARIENLFEQGRLVKTTRKDAGGQVLSWKAYAYDQRGHRVSETDSRTGTTLFFYDDQGRMVERRAPNPETGKQDEGCLATAYTYDALGQLTSTTIRCGGTR